MDDRTLEMFELLGRILMWGAIGAIILAIAAAVGIASSESTIPGIDELQRENRGVVALLAFGSGVAAAGVLAGLGAIIRLLVAGQRRSPAEQR